MSDTLGRPVRESKQEATLFPDEPEWRTQWWGMPTFAMSDATPKRSIVVNFMTDEDVTEFARRTGLPVSTRSDSTWFPYQEPLRGDVYYDGPKTDSRYPVCIPSKGRAKIQKTGPALDRLGVTYRFFVEETEYDAYCETIGPERVERLPFHDLGQGSIPARNFIWEWAKERGYARHWVLDDNIQSFCRCTNNRRLAVVGGGFFNAMEDFADRYENIAAAGPHDKGFVKDRDAGLAAYITNTRVYSCILLDTKLPHRWRGRYNEDTDLCLRLLKDGYCTVLFRALLMDKPVTAGAKGKPMAGGNTDTVYATDDHRLAFAESLRDQHPDCVKVVWKFNRWHHQVDYSAFRTKLKPRAEVVPRGDTNDYGMSLVRAKAKENES